MGETLTHRHIEVFRAFMMAGSVTEAAALLRTSQPTVSRELARLESLLGYALFERKRGRLRPTGPALALFDEVTRSYQSLEHVAARARTLGRGDHGLQLSVLCLPALGHALLPGACATFMSTYVNVQLSITPQESPVLEDWMSAQRFDLGLTEQAHSIAPAGTSLVPVLELDEVCVLPSGHPLLAKRVLSPNDFHGHAFVSLSAADPYRAQLDTLFTAYGVSRDLRLETHSAAAVCAMVRAGIGAAVVNPLTALACAGPDLHLRRFSVSVPFRVSGLTPLYRPAQPLVGELITTLIREAAALKQRLELELSR